MKKLISKILVPIDGSDVSRKALKFAIDMAKSTQAKLTIIEVVEEFGPLPGYYEAAPAGKDRVKWISEQRFEKVHPILAKEKVAWNRVVVEGYAADQICEYAAKNNYSIIIMGSRGLSPLGRFLMGSVSDRVVHHAPCSVTIVR